MKYIWLAFRWRILSLFITFGISILVKNMNREYKKLEVQYDFWRKVPLIGSFIASQYIMKMATICLKKHKNK